MTSPGDGVASAGAVALDVEPDAREFYPRLRAQVLPAADLIGKEVGARISQPVIEQVQRAVPAGVQASRTAAQTAAATVGQQTGATLGKSIKDRIEAALKSLPEVNLDADSSKIDKKVANIRRQLQELGDKRIGIDLDEDEAEARIKSLKQQLASLARDVEKVREAGGTVDLKIDAIAAGVELARLEREVKAARAEAEKPIEVTARVSGSSFERDLARRVQAAQAALPAIDVGVDTTDADREIARIAAELAGLGDAHIGVDLDAGEALAHIERIRAELVTLGAESADVRIKVDAAAAEGELAAFEAAVIAVSANDVDVQVDVDAGPAIAQLGALVAAQFAASGGFGVLIAAGIALSPALIPIIAAVVAALGAIGPAAAAGALGIGVLALGFSGVVGAVQKITAEQNKATASTAKLAQTQNQTAAATRQLASARASLSNTEANAAEASRASADKVKQAEQALTASQAAAKIAQEGLTAARKAAVQAQEDLASSVAGGALAQRAALLDVTEAQQSLDDTMTNPQSTNLERQRAQLNYDQAKQNLVDITTRNQRLNEQQDTANKAGIEGSTQVQAARQKIATADADVAAKQKALADARHASDVQARQSAFSIAQAQNSVISAQAALAQSYQKTAVAGVAAGTASANAFKGHSQEFKDFVLYILGVKDAFTQVRNAAERGLLPGVEAGIKAIVPVLPQISKVVYEVALAMGELFKRAGQALASPFWLNFFTLLGQFAGPLLGSFGTILGSVAKAFASLLIAFMPLSNQFIGGLAKMAQGFAVWAASLADSDGFKAFIAYATANAPVLLGLLGSLVVLAVKLGIVFAPLGAILLKGLGLLVGFLANLDPSVLAIIVGVIGALILALVSATSPIALIVAGITLVVGALVYAYTHFKTFHDVVDAVFHAVAVAAVWLWQNVLKPTFDFIVAAAIAVGGWFVNLYQHYIKPVFDLIGAVISFWWRNVTKPIFDAIVFVIKNFVAPIIVALYKNFIHPYFTAIGVVISVVWAIIKVIFGLIQIAVKVLGAVFVALYTIFVKPYVDLLVAAITYAWTHWLKPTFQALGDIIEQYVAPAFKRGVDAVSKIWATIRDIAKVPIKFVIQTVLNNGLLAAYNKLATMFDIAGSHNVQIPLPAGFADGGLISGQGGPTSDSILARLSNGEYVIPAAIVKAFGVGFFDFLIGKSPRAGQAIHPGDGSEGLAFAKGGAVPGFAEGGFVGRLTSLWGKLSDPIAWVKDQVVSLVDKVPGGGYVTDVLKGLGSQAVGWAVSWLKKHLTGASSADGKYVGPVNADTAAVQQFITAQAGKPYIWASTGPVGYDCSGALSAVYNLMHGKQPYSRVFSTSNEQGYFPKPGHGLFTAGMAHGGQRGAGPTIGHTAGNLAGLAFESRGGDGFVVGPRATSVDSFAYTGTYDSGGWLMPGLTVAYNGTGERERILTGPQWGKVESALSGAGSGDSRPNVTYQVTPKYATVDAGEMRSIVAEQNLRDRVGRPG